MIAGMIVVWLEVDTPAVRIPEMLTRIGLDVVVGAAGLPRGGGPLADPHPLLHPPVRHQGGQRPASWSGSS